MTLNPEQFGMTERDMAEMKGKALAGHIWDSTEDILAPGGFGNAMKMDAFDRLSKAFPGHKLGVDEDGSPFHTVRHGSWSGTWHGGTYMETHHDDLGGPIEALHIDEEDRGSMTHGKLTRRLREWAKESGDDYIRNW